MATPIPTLVNEFLTALQTMQTHGDVSKATEKLTALYTEISGLNDNITELKNKCLDLEKECTDFKTECSNLKQQAAAKGGRKPLGEEKWGAIY